MKLRNKKTGEVAEIYLDNYTATNNIVSVCLKVKDDVSPDGYKYIASYTNLVELLEEWEDYVPEKPRIEDEKVRKLVGDWAKINGIKEVDYLILGAGLSVFGYDDIEINFTFQVEGVVDDKRYTITELCGEEEDA